MTEQADPDFGWLKRGTGDAPTLRWCVSTDANLMDFSLSRETGEIVAADSLGGLSLYDRRGKLVGVNGGFDGIQLVAWSDNGNGGAILTGENTLLRIRQSLSIRWSVKLPAAVLALDVDPFGNHIAVSLANGITRIYNWKKSRITEFETVRPLNHVRFVGTKRRLIGAAEYGLLCSHSFDGSEIWNETLWTNVGDLSLTGNGKVILVAGYNHGVQQFDDDGSHRGSFMVEGTPGLVSTSFVSERVAVATIERHLYWLDSDGEMIWAAESDTDIVGIQTDALGNGIVCGLSTGQILRLTWDDSDDE
jgi:hypothetical protein